MSKFISFFIACFLLIIACETVFADTSADVLAHLRAEASLGDIKRGDLNFFFDGIVFENGKWKFKLSPNVRGFLWRIKGDHSDVTAACESGQVLDFDAGSSLQIKRKDLILTFLTRRADSFDVIMKIRSESNSDVEERNGILTARGEGFGLAYVRE